MNGPQHTALSSPADTDTKFLTAPGELAGRILAFDWASTPLGPVSTWSQSLKTAVSLMLNSPQPMWIGWGKEATFLYNDAYIAVLSMAKHPWALGRPMQEVWSEIWDYCLPLVDKVFQRGEATIGEGVRLFMNRGDFLEEVYYSFSYSPIRDESGNVAGLFCPNFDTTARHLNTRRLRTLSDLAAKSLVERTVSAACASAMQTLSRNSDDLPFCMLYLADTGDSAQLLQTSHLYETELIAPATIDLRAPPAGIAGQIAHVVCTGETRIVDIGHLDGLPRGLANQRITQAITLPLTVSAQKQPIGAILAAVNPARRLEDDYRAFFDLMAGQVSTAIQNARAAEEEKMRTDMLVEIDRAKTAFFSNVSHEFRTPLTLMLAPINDALHDRAAPLPPAQQERLELMRRNAMRLQKLVNNLLDFSRIQAKRMQAAFQQVDLAMLTSDLASGFRSMIEQAGMQFEVDCPRLTLPTYVDPSMWEKIVLNLLSNAFKFTLEGAIRVQLRAEGTHAVLTVSDTGCGISATELPRLFERFHRIAGAHSRTHEGSGIGLALVQDLVKLHGGDIHAHSVERQGTTFTIRLPFGFAHLDAQQVSHAPSTHTRTELAEIYVTEAGKWTGSTSDMRAEESAGSHLASASRARILVVDDNVDMRNYLCRLLQPHWRIDTARDGMQALESVRHHAPDLILSDAMMPQLDGFGLLERLRGDPATRDIPFIMLSARAGEEARVEGLQAGVDEYLVKPFSGTELIVRIASTLLRRQLHAVENSFAQRLHSILAQAPVAIAITRGPDHVFELANERYMELTGHRRLIGKRLRDAFPELEGHTSFDRMDEVYRTRQSYQGNGVEADLRRGSEGRLEKCFFNFVHQPLLDQQGETEGIAIVAYEVTELTNAQRAAESANRAKDEFLAMLGHELRNPLAPIITALQLMQLRGVTAAEKERGIIERQAKHLVALVDDLLDVSRVTQSKIQLRKILVETGEVVAKAIETASPLLEEKRHALSIDVPASGLRIDADPERLAQVIANLLTNASKYTEPNGLVQISARRDGGNAVITVSDNGIGISSDMLPIVFDMFVQERQALNRSRGGLGLGLAIAKSMTVLHGGTIEAHSEGQGRGSTFIVRIPLAAEKAAHAPSGPDGAIHPANRGDGLQILIVDDNEDAALLLSDMLQLYGHCTAIAHDGYSALETAEKMQADVALLDIGLPGMDGYELARRLRRQKPAQNMHLIAITGYGQQNDQRQARSAGFAGHLVKPIDMQQLDTMLKTYMENNARNGSLK